MGRSLSTDADKQSRFEKTCKTNQLVTEGYFRKKLSLNLNSIFRYKHLRAVFELLGWKVAVVDDVLSSHEQCISPKPSLMKTL